MKEKRQILSLLVGMVFLLTASLSCSSGGSGGSKEGTDPEESDPEESAPLLETSIQLTDSNFDGIFDQKVVLTFDSDGNITKRQEDEDNDGELDHIHEFTFDSHNNPTKETLTPTEGDPTVYTYEWSYDSENRHTEIKGYKDGELYETDNLEYGSDEQGNYHIFYQKDENDSLEYIEMVYCGNNPCDKLENVVFGYGMYETSFVYEEQEHDDYKNLTAVRWYELSHSKELSLENLQTMISENPADTLEDDMDSESYSYEYDSYGNKLVVVTKNNDGENKELITYWNTYDDSETFPTDQDQDGIPAAYDCDDSSSSLTISATETCDGVDNDCDGEIDEEEEVDFDTYYKDSDGDGYGDPDTTSEACSQPDSYVTNSKDCNDNDSTITTDKDYLYVDSDGDGYGDADSSGDYVCAGTEGYADSNDDCNDADTSINPAATEVCDGMDNDCDGDLDDGVTTIYYPDDDADGYGDKNDDGTEACSQPAGYVEDNSDCDDANSTTHPGAIDSKKNGDKADNDCDGEKDEGTSKMYKG